MILGTARLIKGIKNCKLPSRDGGARVLQD